MLNFCPLCVAEVYALRCDGHHISRMNTIILSTSPYVDGKSFSYLLNDSAF